MESAPGFSVIKLICSVWDGTLQTQRLGHGSHSARPWQGCRRCNSERIHIPRVYLSLFPHLCSQREGNPGLSTLLISNTPPYIEVNRVVLKIISKLRKTRDSGIVTNPDHGGICLKESVSRINGGDNDCLICCKARPQDTSLMCFKSNSICLTESWLLFSYSPSLCQSQDYSFNFMLSLSGINTALDCSYPQWNKDFSASRLCPWSPFFYLTSPSTLRKTHSPSKDLLSWLLSKQLRNLIWFLALFFQVIMFVCLWGHTWKSSQ